jgi:hypothetical protein
MKIPGTLDELRYLRALLDDAIKAVERICELGGRLDVMPLSNLSGLDDLVKATEQIGEVVEQVLEQTELRCVLTLEQEPDGPV